MALLTLDATTTTACERRTAEQGSAVGGLHIPIFGAWAIEPIRTALELATLEAGWDAEGSPPPTREAVRVAINIITVIAELDIHDLPGPRIVPVPGGGVQLEWQLGDRYLEIEVAPDGSAGYLAVSDTGEEDEQEFPVWAPRQVKDLIDRLTAAA